MYSCGWNIQTNQRRKRLIKTFYYVLITITCVVDFGNRIAV